jgi:transposase
MRPQRPISEDEKKSLQELLKKTKTKANFQRVQSVWLRAYLSLTSSQVAQAVGWSPGTIRRLWSQYFDKGEKALIGKGRGGRHRGNLSVEEEAKILGPFFEKSTRGGVLVANEIKVTYEAVVGHRVPKSTIYRMLARHGWRKIAPRPRHPKADFKGQESFKKKYLE